MRAGHRVEKRWLVSGMRRPLGEVGILNRRSEALIHPQLAGQQYVKVRSGLLAAGQTGVDVLDHLGQFYHAVHYVMGPGLLQHPTSQGDPTLDLLF